MTRDEIVARLKSRILVVPKGCWEWQGSRMPNGYGQFVHLGERLAHRVSYVVHHGPLVKGAHILHVCDNRSCVNPNHLVMGTPKQNSEDMFRKKRDVSFNRNKTHCKYGHEFSASNTNIDGRGMRACRACVTIRMREWRSRK